MKRFTREQLDKLEELMLNIGQEQLEQSPAFDHLSALENLRKEMVSHLAIEEFLNKDKASNINWIADGKVLAVVDETVRIEMGDLFIKDEIGAFLINKNLSMDVAYKEGLDIFAEYFTPMTSYGIHEKEFYKNFYSENVEEKEEEVGETNTDENRVVEEAMNAMYGEGSAEMISTTTKGSTGAKEVIFYNPESTYPDETEVMHNGELHVVLRKADGTQTIIPKKFYNPSMRNMKDKFASGSMQVVEMLGKSSARGIDGAVPDEMKADVEAAKDKEEEKIKNKVQIALKNKKIGQKMNLSGVDLSGLKAKSEEKDNAGGSENKEFSTDNVVKAFPDSEKAKKILKEYAGKVFFFDREEGIWKAVSDDSIVKDWDTIAADGDFFKSDENGVAHIDGTELYYDETIEYREAFQAVLDEKENAPDCMKNLIAGAEVYMVMMEERDKRLAEEVGE